MSLLLMCSRENRLTSQWRKQTNKQGCSGLLFYLFYHEEWFRIPYWLDNRSISCFYVTKLKFVLYQLDLSSWKNSYFVYGEQFQHIAFITQFHSYRSLLINQTAKFLTIMRDYLMFHSNLGFWYLSWYI